jgi:flagellar biosynthesis protein FliQ
MDGDEALPVSDAAESTGAAAASGAIGWQPMPEGWRPRALVWRPWRWHAFLDPVQWALAALVVVAAIAMLAGTVLSIFLLVDAVNDQDLSVPAAVAIGVVAIGAGGALGAWLLRTILRAGARRLACRLPPGIPGAAFVQACVLSRDQPREGWTAKGRIEWLANLRSGTDAAACLDAYSAQAAAAVTRIPDRLEPERVGSSGSVRAVRVMIGLSIFGAWLLWRGAAGWSSMIVPGVMLAVGAFGILRLATSGRLTAPMTVGPGWVKWGDLAWSVRDSVLVVERIGYRTVQATFVGPAGVVRLRLRTDPGLDGHFATLWTRWMHDRPEAPGAGLDE